VVDVNDSFFLLTAQFKCPSAECNISFLLTIPECMAQLPLEITSTFPAVLSHRSAVSRFIADEVSMMVDHAVGPGQLARIVQERHTREHTERELAYYAVCYSVVKQRRESPNTLLPHLKDYKKIEDARTIPTFSAFSDPDWYAGFTPSGMTMDYCFFLKYLAPYLSALLVKEVERKQHFFDLDVQRRDGRDMAIDHSFKVSILQLNSHSHNLGD
jgi:hypothetical protein